MLPWYWLLILWVISSACLAFGMYAHGRNIGQTEVMVGEHSASTNSQRDEMSALLIKWRKENYLTVNAIEGATAFVKWAQTHSPV